MSKKKGVQYSLTKGDNVLYNGKPTQGITKAALYDTEYDVVDIIDRTVGVGIAVVDTSRYELKNHYSATTSCLPTEDFSEEVGEEIAKHKVLHRYNADKIAMIDVAIADLTKILDRLKKQRKIAEDRIERNAEFLRTAHEGPVHLS